jgi:putative glutamine amidotransferase
LKPLIGIPTRTQDEGDVKRYAGFATYTRAVDLAGGAPVMIPLGLNDETLHEIFSRLDGLLLSGGYDIHPREYGEALEPYCGKIDSERDRIELLITRWALAERMPIFAICRGIQTLNIAGGGSLYQDIATQLEGKLTHPHINGNPFDYIAHTIEINPGSRLAHALGTTNHPVNSLHHQGLKQVAAGFHIVARAPDGIIEGIEPDDPERFVLAVQFHPEGMIDSDPRMIDLFKAFVNAIVKNKQQ